MPVRATKRGAERTPLNGDFDVVICGASFAGLAVARELSGSGAKVLLIDRYEVGERQTSACAAPTAWLENLGLMGSVRQTFGDLVTHTRHGTFRWHLPWTFSTFDYRELCGLLKDQSPDVPFDTAKVEDITRARDVHTAQTHRGVAPAACRPAAAAAIRAAVCFGVAGGRERRAVVAGSQTRAAALARYAEFSDAHRWKFEAMWHVQSLFSFVNRSPRATTLMMRALTFQGFVDWSFRHYLNIAPPEFVSQGRPPAASGDDGSLQ